MRNTFKNRALLLLVISLALVSCGSQQKEMTYLYVDQNNNRFQITASEIRYIPITASESSSGQYDGGDKATVAISEKTFKEISNLAEAVFVSEGITTQRRMLMSVLSVYKDGENKHVIVTPSEERKQLETALRELIQ